MSEFDTAKTPDYSPLVVHFTRDRKFASPGLIRDGHPVYEFRDHSAVDRLLNILRSKVIYATPMPFLPKNAPAVCFTECIWDALTRLAARYSPYGVVLSKRFIFDNGGGPALYARGNVLQKLWDAFPESMEPFVAPFDPEAILKKGVPLDWLAEREWRLPKNLSFEYRDVQYVIVNTIEDARNIVHQIGADHLPEERLIPIEVYATIRKAWSRE
jgi:hypothetical protein